ncbi:MAG: hypothetical protein II304_06000 [Bacteroidales bacterium]|nr:hypothetical protein [Bacteroidales bacterium]
MLKTKETKYTYETAADGAKVYAKEVLGSSYKELTVTELRDFLNELISAGYGDYCVEADTQDGETYSVRNEVLAYDLSKTIKIF